MTRSRMRNISKFLAKTAIANTNEQRVRFSGEPGTIKPIDSSTAAALIQGLGVGYELTQDSLPISGLTIGQMAFVESAHDGARLYLSNGSGWYNVSLVNITPTFDSNLNDSAQVVDSNTSLIITNPASDLDNPDTIITYSGTASDSAQYIVTITNDSSVWTFDPLSADSVYSNVAAGNIPDSAGGTFTYTFQATDGINTATKEISITYNVPAGPAYPITWPAQTTYGGQTYGYAMGGVPGVNAARTMDRYSLSSTGNATDVGDLATPVLSVSGAGASGTNGYTFGGQGTSPGYVKYQYSSGASVHSESFTTFPYAGNRHGASSVSGNRDKGYNIGGQWGNSPFNNGVKDYYDRITYSTDTWASDVGDLSGYSDRWGHQVNSSPTTQYSTGGGIYATSSPNGENLGVSIFSFPFASEGSMTDIGYDQPGMANVYGGSASSTTDGYTFGGQNYTPPTNPKIYDIAKYPFANNANAVDVGNMGSASPHGVSGVSSRTYGYMQGGYGPSNSNGIGYFPFASDGNATDVGDLTVARYYTAGGQY